MFTRAASTTDADDMGGVLRDIIALTSRDRPNDIAFVTSNYIEIPGSICCTVAIDDGGAVVGFQSLIRAEPANKYGVPEGWGIIGTHISPRAHRRGVASALFEVSKAAARRAGLGKIDAYIAAGNASALRYYDAMGFETYRESDTIVQKAYTVG